MKTMYFKALIFQLLLTMLFAFDASATEYKIILGKGAFGIPLRSQMKEYVNVLGNPDGTINMGKDRIGLIYGQKLLLIFWKNKLWEIVVWNEPPIHAFGYVRNGKDRDLFQIVLENNIRVNILRNNVMETINHLKLKDKDSDIEEDEYGAAFIHRNTNVLLSFEYNKLKPRNGVGEQLLEGMQITFEENNPTIVK